MNQFAVYTSMVRIGSSFKLLVEVVGDVFKSDSSHTQVSKWFHIDFIMVLQAVTVNSIGGLCDTKRVGFTGGQAH